MATTLTTYSEARDALRQRDLRQALYADGHRLMTGVIVNLHGDDHLARRRLENRLFRRDTFAWYESQRMPAILDAVLAGPIAAGHGDLPTLARRAMMTLSVDVAGVDLPSGTGEPASASGGEFDPAVFERFYDLMGRLARASTVAHATGDPEAIIAAGDEALAEFAADFFRPALERRQQLLARFEAGELAEDDLPRDVLTTLLRNQDRLELPDEYVLREIAYFPWVGSHSTAAQLVHAMHHMFEWLAEHPGDRERLVGDDEWRQSFVHESMRLHPASPVALRTALADVELRSGRVIPAGEPVVIDLEQANRDPEFFGADPETFDPDRTLAEGVAPWGLSFGHGPHACLGQELAGGLAPVEGPERHLLGAVVVMSGAMLAAGARPDPDHPATADTTTTRQHWATYPVCFEPVPARSLRSVPP